MLRGMSSRPPPVKIVVPIRPATHPPQPIMGAGSILANCDLEERAVLFSFALPVGEKIEGVLSPETAAQLGRALLGYAAVLGVDVAHADTEPPPGA